MKKYLLFIFIVSLSFNTYAQNTEMAKAFYKKALQAYEDKDYKEALKLIEKTKENLNGNTNPDIIYIEAKSRFNNDLNINKTKELFNQFLNESSTTDERRSEVSSILVDVETSRNYYDNGNKHFYKHIKNGIKYTTEYDINGNKIKSFYKNNFTYYIDNKIFLNIYTDNNPQSKTVPNFGNFIRYQLKYKEQPTEIYYKDNKKYLTLKYSSSNSFYNNEIPVYFYLESLLPKNVYPPIELNDFFRWDSGGKFSCKPIIKMTFDEIPNSVKIIITKDFPGRKYFGHLKSVVFKTEANDVYQLIFENSGSIISYKYNNYKKYKKGKISKTYLLNSEKTKWIEQ